MDFNMKWEMDTGGETKSGTETINAESVLDALDLFSPTGTTGTRSWWELRESTKNQSERGI